ncbi:MAG TPA: DUF2243 domain-containing protein [Ramlibacter sp.]|jgi:uncharacterized membrane protein
MQDSSRSDGARPLRRGAFLVGLGLGGFFDGILLHQVLQWHHFLSNVDAPALRDMRMQILADGLFHVLMYFIAAIGLALLWRGRKECAQPGAGTLLWGSALLGFCIWHFIDIVLAHWVVGIHRVRVDAPNPLAWDLGWLFLFGVVPLFFAWRLRKGGGSGSSGGGRAAATLGIAALLAGPIAALPAGDSDQVMVLFAPGTSGAAAFDALARADARVLWVDRSGGLWAVKMADAQGGRSQLYRNGAMLVSNSPIALGCFSWTRTAL